LNLYAFLRVSSMMAAAMPSPPATMKPILGAAADGFGGFGGVFPVVPVVPVRPVVPGVLGAGVSQPWHVFPTLRHSAHARL